MLSVVIYAMVYLGSALMVRNIYCFASYARRIQEKKDWGKERTILYVPIVLLAFFLLGYLAIGLFGNPDIIIAGILFGGSVFVRIIYLLLDLITNRIQTSERLEAELMAAEESNRAKMSFLSSVSHEMRTPMNAIVGFDTIALKNPDLPDETRDHLKKIGVAAGHLQNLIDNVLDLSSVESERLVLKKEMFSLGEVLDEIDVALQMECIQKGLEYASDVSGDVCTEFLGDASRLRQVLLIVLDNAVKFTPAPGTVSLVVEPAIHDAVPAAGQRYAVHFVISDTGIGIDEEFLPKLFGAFSQEDATTTNRYGGSGLGLALAKRIVNLMDGDIAVQSAKGMGSTFVVTVSLDVPKIHGTVQEAEQVDMAAPAVADTDQSASPATDQCVAVEPVFDVQQIDLSGKHMLVVDDIEVNAEIVMDLLDLEDVSADYAENGRVALDKFAQSPVGYYDAILMDLRMPVMDGFESTRAIRALDRADARTIPILALTANASEDDKRQTFEAGIDVHLAKPVDADELYYTLDTLVGHDSNAAASQVTSQTGDA